jgi:adenylate cyclase
LPDPFYHPCAEAIREHDGILNKTIGDAVVAVFDFPIQSEDHTKDAKSKPSSRFATGRKLIFTL